LSGSETRDSGGLLLKPGPNFASLDPRYTLEWIDE
jgi:hypothetical protein